MKKSLPLIIALFALFLLSRIGISACDRLFTRVLGKCRATRIQNAFVYNGTDDGPCTWDVQNQRKPVKALILHVKEISSSNCTANLSLPGTEEKCLRTAPFCHVYTALDTLCDTTEIQRKTQREYSECVGPTVHKGLSKMELRFEASVAEPHSFTIELKRIICRGPLRSFPSGSGSGSGEPFISIHSESTKTGVSEGASAFTQTSFHASDSGSVRSTMAQTITEEDLTAQTEKTIMTTNISETAYETASKSLLLFLDDEDEEKENQEQEAGGSFTEFSTQTSLFDDTVSETGPANYTAETNLDFKDDSHGGWFTALVSILAAFTLAAVITTTALCMKHSRKGYEAESSTHLPGYKETIA